MGLKKWMQQLQPAALYVVLMLSVVHFLGQMVICHLTHALTLLIDSCHMLCNIISLVGCLMTLKYGAKASNSNAKSQKCDVKDDTKADANGSDAKINEKECVKEKSQTETTDEKQLRNTFGWTRIEVLRMLIVGIFIVSLSLSVLVESLQTLIHINHMGDIRYPFIIMIMGFIGLILNIFCYILIGGFTYHQGSLLHVNTSKEIVLDSVATLDSIKQSQNSISRFRPNNPPQPENKQRESFGNIAKDITSCLIVIIFAIIAIFVDEHTAKYIDPTLAIVSSLLLLFLNYPYLKESGLILLQTIPNSMNIEVLHGDLLKSFPKIINIHDLHVWQQTTTKIVLTMHVIFSNPLDYIHQCDEVVQFLSKQGVTQITIQPEFQSSSISSTCNSSDNKCLMQCKSESCSTKHCCNLRTSLNLSSITISNTKAIESDVNVNGDVSRDTT